MGPFTLNELYAEVKYMSKSHWSSSGWAEQSKTGIPLT